MEKSHDFTLSIYKRTASFPKEELYGLVSQLRRSTSSIPINLAEGSARATDLDTLKFYSYSFASAQETEYTLLLSKDLGYIDADSYKEYEKQILEIKAMLYGLIKTIKSRIKQ